MHDGTTLADVIKERHRAFKELRPAEKVGFIWDYYKIPILLFLLIAGALGSLLYHYIFENQKTILYGMAVNVYADDEETVKLPSLYLDYAEASAKEYEMLFDSSLFMGVEYGVESEADYGTVVKLSTTIGARALDFLICDQYTFESYEAVAGFYDLKELLPTDLYDQLDAQGRIIFGQADNDESAARLNTYPMAIDITDTDFAAQYGMSPLVGDTVYFTIIANSQRPEEAVNMVRMIFHQEYVPVTEE